MKNRGTSYLECTLESRKEPQTLRLFPNLFSCSWVLGLQDGTALYIHRSNLVTIKIIPFTTELNVLFGLDLDHILSKIL